MMALNGDGKGAWEEKKKRKKKNKRETMRIGKRERGVCKNIKRNNVVFCFHFDILQ
jgi:hypothetical protein